MNSWFRIALQALTYAAFAVVLGYLSASPAYDYAAEEYATVKLSLSHAANRVKPCVRLTPKEIAELAPNMRRPEKCERERLPLTVEFEIDGEIVTRIEAAPSGLWNDGPASVYERFEVAPGTHTIIARLRESDRPDGWDYVHSETVTLLAGRYFTVTFRAETGGFSFR
ncbi:MAG: hypothetical protein OEV10_06805 [Gammaproteobacteria bacterium]|jgi:hypothetical protein|nr:hypothetical protein [Gammaproteobacteria bacterium]MDH3863658.1 hypothetical protein [Gammaproteobacteria bacterium]NCF61167.1 hypothetical protein [Gammaproteobacteria bacterium]